MWSQMVTEDAFKTDESARWEQLSFLGSPFLIGSSEDLRWMLMPSLNARAFMFPWVRARMQKKKNQDKQAQE